MRRVLAILLLASPAAFADYSQHPRTAELVERLRGQHGFSAGDLAQVRATLKSAEKVEKLIEREQTAAEKTLTWDAYRKIHIHERNLENGSRFLKEHHYWLARAEARYGVPPHVIAAILGVETKYGSYTGRARVLDALTTQGFDHPTRSDFFFSELVEFFVLCRDRGLDPGELQGSYAGAMGAAQFMPSNYRRLAVDFDENGITDLWTLPDAIGSIGNYLVRYDTRRSWQRGQPMAVPATVAGARPDLPVNAKFETHRIADFLNAGISPGIGLPTSAQAGLVRLDLDASPPDGTTTPEYWLGLRNFYSVMSYNPRVYYAMAVTQLAEALKEATP